MRMFELKAKNGQDHGESSLVVLFVMKNIMILICDITDYH